MDGIARCTDQIAVSLLHFLGREIFTVFLLKKLETMGIPLECAGVGPRLNRQHPRNCQVVSTSHHASVSSVFAAKYSYS